MKKKLLFVYYSLDEFGGINRVLTNLANELAEDYDVTILSIVKGEKTSYEINNNIKIIYLDSYSHWAIKKVIPFLRRRLSFISKIENLVNYLADFSFNRTLNAWLVNNHKNFDTIITCMYKLSIQASLNPKINYKTIAWEHTDHNIGGKLYNPLRKKNYHKLKNIVAINHHSFEYYKNISKNVKYIPNIIGQPFESINQLTEKDNIITFVGRLDTSKNVIDLLQIFKESQLENWKLHIIGGGNQEEILKKFCIEHKMNNDVIFHGVKDINFIFKHLKKTKIFTLTSLAEALPTVLIEAMMCGNILLAYDCNYGPSDIINKNNGVLIPLRNKTLFIEKLKELTTNTEYLDHLIIKSFQDSKNWKKDERLKEWKKIL